MCNNGAGFGGFLVGLGLGWYMFRYMDFALDIIAYILILMGSGMIINAILSRGRRRSPIQGLFGGIIGGLILALFITQGFGIVGSIFSEFGVFGSMYQASDSQVLSGQVDFDRLYLRVDNRNGHITVETWERNEYRIDLTLRAKGATDSKAEERLENVKVIFSDTVTGDVQRLQLEFGIPDNQWSNFAISIDVKVPEGVLIELNLDTRNGRISLENIVGDRIVLQTSNGEISLNHVRAESIIGTTSNGRISGQIDGELVELRTSNGNIDLAISGAITGTYDLSTSNGSIDLSVPNSGEAGYSIDLRVGLGGLNINLDDLNFSIDESRRVVAETEDFKLQEIRVSVKAETSIGSINVNQR